METATVRYLRSEYPGATFYRSPPRIIKTPWGPIYPGQNHPGGYGRRISTDYVCRLTPNGRVHRVYCICFSNCGSLYVRAGGACLYIDETEPLRECPALPG